jgi:heme/copper-type cytochrome/quinol oxidase subunit 2
MDDEYRLAWDVVSELILIGLVTLVLTVATVWIVWYVVKAGNPDEVRHLQFFLTFTLVIIPFVMVIYFGSAIIIDDAITAPPWPTALPLKLSSRQLLAAAVIYIGLTVWQWLRWRKL